MATRATKTQSQTEEAASSSKPATCFYKLSAGELPDELFRKEATASDWIGPIRSSNSSNSSNSNSNSNSSKVDLPPWMETTSDPSGFAPGSLRRVIPIDRMVDLERCIGISLYMVGNVSPFALPLLAVTRIGLGLETAGYAFGALLAYHLGLYAVWRLVFVPIFLKRYNRGPTLADDLDASDPMYSQYLYTERNVTKYCSTSYVWPDTLQRPAPEESPCNDNSNNNNNNNDRPLIFCVVPHGLAPYGIVGYPYFSKVWNSRLCSWTCAPVLLKLPFVGHYLRAIGYVPAKSRPILEALTKKDRNVGVVLDGIDGMFHNASNSNSNSNSNTEVAAIGNRKGIAKIALKANAALVPVYGFGHALVYDVWVDPWGILRHLSAKLGVSLTPFFGRWGWFLGPPKREFPIVVCLGDPIYPPSSGDGNSDGNSDGNISQQQIDEHHARLVEGFQKVFETHKRGYYGEAAGAKKKLVVCN
eukprot:jgi/Psemu1/59016/gm1.59016_g